jgi:type IV pilus assembly protein PilW
MKYLHRSGGFTLVELLMTMLISMLVMATVFTAYISNQKIHTAQQHVVEMQQNIRAGGDMIMREIKLAGYNPNGDADTAGITAAFPDAFAFSMDLTNTAGTGDPDGKLDGPGEHIAYDSYVDGGNLYLGRTASNAPIVVTEIVANEHWEATGHQQAAENIEAIEFLYTLEDETTTTEPDTSDYDRIRAVTVTILSRTPFPDQKFTNSLVYTPASGNNFKLDGANPANDNYRRRLVSHVIKLRNMGM